MKGQLTQVAEQLDMKPVDVLQARVDWQDAETRDEFNNDVDAFLAFKKAKSNNQTYISKPVVITLPGGAT